MSEDRKKPGVAFWATVVVVVALVGYPLSFGPACWITSRMNFGAEAVQTVYRPMTLVMSRSATASEVLRWYARLAAPRGWMWIERIYGDWVWVNLAISATDEELDFWFGK